MTWIHQRGRGFEQPGNEPNRTRLVGTPAVLLVLALAVVAIHVSVIPLSYFEKTVHEILCK
ncbi:hypothetical protein OBBRIDRAFT_791123 [Obba rivulosa]|uniref:Uncharacterized protein n=1 Tax=Obba rivulosa TaxID=1052685 RepID=A0A8E2AXT8_9APHY|nr:hypothetical protein OBBRIDRAFT_791123 [Obba rivulosa]